MAVDGELRFDTKIDTTGFNSGTKSIKSGLGGITSSLKGMASGVTDSTAQMNTGIVKTRQSLKGMASGVTDSTAQMNTGIVKTRQSLKGMVGAVGLAFSVTALVRFGKEAVNVASELEEIQNVVDVTFGQGNKKIQDFTTSALESFGLSERSAKKYVSTLGSMGSAMGFASKDNENMSISLTKLIGDFSSFRNISTEEAMTAMSAVYTGETETLKRYGIVITDVNLQEYARRQGISKNIAKMTQREKVLLRYNYIMEKTSLMQGDFVRTQDSWANQTRLLQENWKSFLGTIGTGLIQVLAPAVKVLNAMLLSVTKLVKAFSKDSSPPQESQNNFTDSVMGSVEAEKELETSAKKAKKALMGLDEINILDFGEDDKTTDNSDITGALGKLPQQPISVGENLEISTNLVEVVGKVHTLLEPLKTINLDNLKNSLKNFGDALKPLGKTAFDGLEWGYHNVLVPLAEWYIEDVAPRSFETLAIGAELLTGILKGSTEVEKVLVTKIYDPIFKYSKDWLNGVWDSVNDKLKDLSDTIKNSKLFHYISEILKKLSPFIVESAKEMLGVFSLLFVGIEIQFSYFINFFEYVFKQVESILGIVVKIINGDFKGAFEDLMNLLIKNPLKLLKDIFTDTSEVILRSVGLMDEAVEKVEIFGDEISDATKSKVKPFIDRLRDFDDTLMEIDYKNLTIDQSIVDDVMKKTGAIRDTIIKELDSDKNGSLKKLNPLKGAMDDTAYGEILSKINSSYENSAKAVTEGEKRIGAIMSLASSQKRTLTKDEKDEINSIQTRMTDTGIKCLSESEVEYLSIMDRMKDNSTRVSVEQASEILKNSVKTRDETIKNAREQYVGQVDEARRLLDAGVINEAEYDKMVVAAESTKNDTIKKAKEQYDGIIAVTKEKLGENSKYIDNETGEIKTKWGVFTADLKTKWHEMWEDFKVTLSNAKEKIKTEFSELWNGITNSAVDAWNGILTVVEKGVNGTIDILNGFAFKLPDIDLLGKNAGKTLGFNINHVKFNKIPRLATGAVIPPNAEFAAILGDQRHGRNLEAPESLIRQIVREESGKGSGGNWTIQLVDTNGKIKSETVISEFERNNCKNGKTVIPVGT